MNGSRFEIKIDRLIVTGPALDEATGRRLRTLIEEELRNQITSLRKPVEGFQGENRRIDLPDLSLGSVEGERRVARATADAILKAMRGQER